MIFRILIPIIFAALFYIGLRFIDKQSKNKRIEIVYVDVKCDVKLTKKQITNLVKKLNIYYTFLFFIAATIAYNIKSLYLFATLDLIIIIVGILISTKWLKRYGHKIKEAKKKF